VTPPAGTDLLHRVAGIPGGRPIGLKIVQIGTGALSQLPELVAHRLRESGSGEIALLSEAVPMDYAGRDLRQSVHDLLAAVGDVRRIRLTTHQGRAHADARTIDSVLDQLAGCAALVTVGSGTLADIGKAASAGLEGLPHFLVQTALSVNGFADDQSVLLVDGVKRTTPTRWPDVLIADTDVLAGAPATLNAAGVGDLMAMFTAPADWLLADLLGMGTGYSAPLVSAVRERGPALFQAAHGLAAGDRESIEIVASILTLSGLSMGAAGTTAPSSGAEHTISHLLDMSAAREGRAAALHGAQVGACTVLASLVWQRVLARIGEPGVRLDFPREGHLAERVRAAFDQLDPSGAMAEECWRLYRSKLQRWNARREQLEATDWPRLAVRVRTLLAEPAEIVDALRRSGAVARIAELTPAIDAPTVHWALANCHLMRDRFTVVDLAYFLGVWQDSDVAGVLADAASLGAGP
jgi:glycerol-1-phosphate dehydrogenase [NAD(P)+]